jgi:hypothetical protein
MSYTLNTMIMNKDFQSTKSDKKRAVTTKQKDKFLGFWANRGALFLLQV